jgi:UDPglucose--hexose-1-phosphate uridylyltransferase
VLPPQLTDTPHRRRNPLTGEWVLVSPHRNQRPWQGQIERRGSEASVAYDPKCYLCPGNERSGGQRNPAYESTFVFTNDFSALKPIAQPIHYNEGSQGLLVAESEAGICKVVCFSPRHDLTSARMSAKETAAVIDVWMQMHQELGAQPGIRYVQIFENRGETMGCSNPHPHCQVWATETIPNEPAKEQLHQAEYWKEHGRCLLCDYVKSELADDARVVCQNEGFVALVPFWAVWPFETLIVSKTHLRDFSGVEGSQVLLADILKRLTTRYDNLFEISFPYSMGFHQAPTDGEPHPEWHLHAHFFPPLLRSATVRKFMVGYEMLATPQRDITPEAAATRLRELSEVHYLERKG